MMTHPQETKHLTPPQCLVQAFKGVRAAARAVDRMPSTVRNMLRRGFVPFPAQVRALELAESQGLDLTARDLIMGREVKGEEA